MDEMAADVFDRDRRARGHGTVERAGRALEIKRVLALVARVPFRRAGPLPQWNRRGMCVGSLQRQRT